jgi:hypothetical protein
MLENMSNIIFKYLRSLHFNTVYRVPSSFSATSLYPLYYILCLVLYYEQPLPPDSPSQKNFVENRYTVDVKTRTFSDRKRLG